MEVLIVLLLCSIFLTSIMFSHRNIIINQKKHFEKSALLQDAKDYIYDCQANNKLMDIPENASITKINSTTEVETYNYSAKKGGSEIEITFSIKKK